MKKITLFGVTVAMLLSSATGAFAAVETFQPNAEGLFTVTADVAGVQKDAMYGVLAVAGDVLSETIDEEDITYIDQITATEAGKFSLANFGLKADAPNSTLYIGGAGLDGATEVAKLQVKVEVKGNKITGQVTSYNPNNATTVTLWKDGVATEYTATIAAAEGSGQVTQTFEIADVPAGTYDVVVTKAVHLTYKVTGVVVAGADIDFTAATDKAYSNISMIVGKITDDAAVNSDDLNTVWNAANYLKSATAEGVNPDTDVNGDGTVNSDDLNTVWNAANYLKTEASCTYAY